MKRRLHQAALTEMMLAFTREQAFAKKIFGSFQAAAFDKIPLMRHQHILDVFRLIEEITLQAGKIEMDNITIFLGEVLKEADRVTAKCE
jgi:hypothetical protein